MSGDLTGLCLYMTNECMIMENVRYENEMEHVN